jgi:hypothetical protein
MDAEAYADMLPWLVFIVVDRKLGLGVAWAAGGALVCDAGLVGWSYWRGRDALLPRVALGVFAFNLVLALVFPAWNHQVSLPRALVVLTLSVLAFGSLRFTPLSESYTVPLVAPGIREDPRFRRVNVQMTLAWGVGSLAVALACGTTALLAGHIAFTLLDWVAPLVLATITILWAAHRWELFRLSVDSVPIGNHAGESGVPPHLPVRMVMGSHVSSGLSQRVVPPLKLAQLAEDQEPEPDGAPRAVIRQLPVRRRDAGAAGIE